MTAAAQCATVGDPLLGASVIVIGPAPPLRGGIAMHTAGLVDHLRATGVSVAAVSYRRLYPNFAFPGRQQRTTAARPNWSEETLDVLDPRTWWALRRRLRRSKATVVLSWWHPVVAPALFVATGGLPKSRLVAMVHNVLPHEWFPGAGLAARWVIGRSGRVVCHSRAQAQLAARRVGVDGAVVVSLPCLLPSLEPAVALPPELTALDPHARVILAPGHPRTYKGIDVLLTAWRRARRPAGAQLLVVGESYLRGSQRLAVQRLAQGDGSILLVDRYVDDAELVSFLMRAELLVAAYRRASQSGWIPIARALGLACLVSDAGGLVEQLEDGRGQVVRADDVASLADGLERYWSETGGGCAQPGRAVVDSAAAKAKQSQEWQSLVEAMGLGARP